MASVINIQSMSLSPQKTLQRSESRMEATMERLSTGLRINRGGDGPAPFTPASQRVEGTTVQLSSAAVEQLSAAAAQERMASTSSLPLPPVGGLSAATPLQSRPTDGIRAWATEMKGDAKPPTPSQDVATPASQSNVKLQQLSAVFGSRDSGAGALFSEMA